MDDLTILSERLRFRGHGDFADFSGRNENRVFEGYYGIQYTHRGNLELSIDGAVPEIVPGPCVFFTRPGPSFTYGAPAGESRSHTFVCFFGPAAEEWNAAGMLTLPGAANVRRLSHPDLFYSTLHRLLDLLAKPNGYFQTRPALLLLDLLFQLREQPPPRERVNVFCEQSIRALQEKILTAPEVPRDFDVEAQKLSVSYSHFRRLFRELTGRSPGQYLLECRLNAAAALLATSPLPVSEIAHRSGFADEFYFSRQFRRHLGVTPSGYRREFFAG